MVLQHTCFIYNGGPRLWTAAHTADWKPAMLTKVRTWSMHDALAGLWRAAGCTVRPGPGLSLQHLLMASFTYTPSVPPFRQLLM